MKSVVIFHMEQTSAMQRATSVGHWLVHTMPVKWHLMSRQLLGDSPQHRLLLFMHCYSATVWDFWVVVQNYGHNLMCVYL